ncbi:hypothetical protein [Microcystis viridis]|jgi:hypothetical protein|uniref:Uncharacterized protein n=1 Tax=Microcystis viridis FACHB-1342 TaxID=2692900 RepID=A0ABR8GDN1_MICVR|nr:hypothetical protein [Microcystis viridis]MBD2601444.1 hypothetical protein [Microcystis viridis FACHB-1342]
MAPSTKGILDDSLFVRPADGEKLSFPILSVGGSTAAYSATLGALKAGAKVCWRCLIKVGMNANFAYIKKSV